VGFVVCAEGATTGRTNLVLLLCGYLFCCLLSPMDCVFSNADEIGGWWVLWSVWRK